MLEEMFDVVDDQDVVIEQLPRSTVHREHRLHRAVHIFVFDSAGRLLVHQRSATKDECPLVWNSSASGHVHAGESYDVAALRELEEELGLRCLLEPLHKFAPGPWTGWEFCWLYRCYSDDVPTFDPEEIVAGEYLELSDLVQRVRERPDDFSPSFRHLFDWYCRLAGVPLAAPLSGPPGGPL